MPSVQTPWIRRENKERTCRVGSLFRRDAWRYGPDQRKRNFSVKVHRNDICSTRSTSSDVSRDWHVTPVLSALSFLFDAPPSPPGVHFLFRRSSGKDQFREEILLPNSRAVFLFAANILRFFLRRFWATSRNSPGEFLLVSIVGTDRWKGECLISFFTIGLRPRCSPLSRCMILTANSFRDIPSLRREFFASDFSTRILSGHEKQLRYRS